MTTELRIVLPNAVPFSRIPTGQCFLRDGSAFVKMEGSGSGINLKTWGRHVFANTCLVTLAKAVTVVTLLSVEEIDKEFPESEKS